MTQGSLFNNPKPKVRFQYQTKNGYELRDAASALIKEVRRGNEEEAFFWAWELSKSFPNYVWKRLLICAVEDVGLGDPNVIVQVQALANAYDLIKGWQKKGKSVDEQFLAQAVLILCRAKKDRVVPDFTCHCQEKYYADLGAGIMKEVPEYALDVHTTRGKQAGKTTVDWWHDTHVPEFGGRNQYSEGCFKFCEREDKKRQ